MLTHRGFASALLVALTLLTVLPTASSRSAEPVSVLLKGHDEEITGFLRRISEARYLLQGGNVYHEFPENQIVTVDGQEAIPESARSGGRLIYTSLREKILPGGDVEVWSHNEVVNEGVTILTGTDWGAAAWEEEKIRSMQVFDAYCNELPVRIIPRGDGTFRVEVDFLVPVAPHESLNLTLRTVRPGAARQEGDGWTYTFNVDFAEDRYLTRKIELPYGAEVTEAYLGCRGVEVEGRQVLISQRYYPAGARDPLTIGYRLP